jgi:hypothetical protein
MELVIEATEQSRGINTISPKDENRTQAPLQWHYELDFCISRLDFTVRLNAQTAQKIVL